MDRYIIWGTGVLGHNIFARLSVKAQVECFLNSRLKPNEERTVLGRKVYHSNSILSRERPLNGAKIIIAVLDTQEPVDQLLACGFKFYDDFLPYHYLIDPAIRVSFFDYISDSSERRAIIRKLAAGRKTCLMFSPCHSDVYKPMLRMCREFTQKYALIDAPNLADHSHASLDRLKDPELYQEADVLIYNKMVHAANSMLKYLPEGCQRLSLTNAYFTGYFPQLRSLPQKELPPEDYWRTVVSWNDKYIDSMLQEGKSEDEIVRAVCSDSYLDPEAVEKWMEDSLDALERNEAIFDIQICDYLRENCRKRLLYYNVSLPYNEVLEEIMRRVLRALGVQNTQDVDGSFVHGLDHASCPVYPSLAHALGEGFERSLPRQYYNRLDLRSVADSGGFTFEEAARYYIRLERGEFEKLCEKR